MVAILLLATQLLAAEPNMPSWICVDGEGPPNWAPQASRYFRRDFEIEKVPASATLALTADDTFEAFLNGKPVGTGETWEIVYRFEVAPFLQPGKNVLAVRAENTAAGPCALRRPVCRSRCQRGGSSAGRGRRRTPGDPAPWPAAGPPRRRWRRQSGSRNRGGCRRRGSR